MAPFKERGEQLMKPDANKSRFDYNVLMDIVPVVACEQIQENEWHLHNIWLVAPKYREMRVINLEYLCIFINAHVLDQISLSKSGYDRRNQMNFKNIDEFDDDELHSQRIPSLRMRSDCPATALGDYLVEISTGESDEHRASKLNVSRREEY
uniref:SFRICE_029715 n=1 Tax=Spodoptera frugiperda TaxID=7108 RepID=A0A2H1WW44_SPOFR